MLSAVFCLLGMDPEQREPGAEDQEEREVFIHGREYYKNK